MPGGGEHLQLGSANTDFLPVVQGSVEVPGGVHHFPEHPILRVQVDGCFEALGGFLSGTNMVVVGVGQQNLLDRAPGNLCCDFINVMRGVNDCHVLVIANNPHIIIDFPGAAVE